MLLVEMKELPYDAYMYLRDMFSDKQLIPRLRRQYENKCFQLAQELKGVFNREGYLAEVLCFKNGDLITGGVKLHNRVFTYHAVVLMGEWLIDLLYEDVPIKTCDYIERLRKDNQELRVDCIMSTGWWDEAGYNYMPTLDDLVEYKY